jgi:hypothetical protein
MFFRRPMSFFKPQTAEEIAERAARRFEDAKAALKADLAPLVPARVRKAKLEGFVAWVQENPDDVEARVAALQDVCELVRLVRQVECPRILRERFEQGMRGALSGPPQTLWSGERPLALDSVTRSNSGTRSWRERRPWMWL